MATRRKSCLTSWVISSVMIAMLSARIATGTPNLQNMDLGMTHTNSRAKRFELTGVPDYVVKFAPELRHDRASKGYPMSAQEFYDAMLLDTSSSLRKENTDFSTLRSGNIPVYYQVRTEGKQTRIMYWWFYGYQQPCWADQGSHNGDWEHIMVILTEDMSAVAAVSFHQHDGHYTRIAGPRDAPCTHPFGARCLGSYGFESSGTHPIVYVGKLAHGAYHYPNDFNAGTVDECAYYADFRNPKSSDDYMESWRNLVDLDSDKETWMIADRKGSFSWGFDGVNTHPTQRSPFDAEHSKACDGSTVNGIKSGGCYQSECLAGDDETADDCLKECESGYTNFGLTCNKGKWPWEWKIYNRLSDGNSYSYDYTLPKTDAGLSRRRQDSSEWGLP